MASDPSTDGTDRIELTDRQRERINDIKQECTEGGRIPEPTDEQIISSLLDTWDAVNQGLYAKTERDRDV